MPIHELRLLREMQASLLERTRVAENTRNNAAAERIAKEQTQLHTLGAELLERVQSQNQGATAGPGGPIPQPEQPAPQGDAPSKPGNPPAPGAEESQEPAPADHGTEALPHAA